METENRGLRSQWFKKMRRKIDLSRPGIQQSIARQACEEVQTRSDSMSNAVHKTIRCEVLIVPKYCPRRLQYRTLPTALRVYLGIYVVSSPILNDKGCSVAEVHGSLASFLSTTYPLLQ